MAFCAVAKWIKKGGEREVDCGEISLRIVCQNSGPLFTQINIHFISKFCQARLGDF